MIQASLQFLALIISVIYHGAAIYVESAKNNTCTVGTNRNVLMWLQSVSLGANIQCDTGRCDNFSKYDFDSDTSYRLS